MLYRTNSNIVNGLLVIDKEADSNSSIVRSIDDSKKSASKSELLNKSVEQKLSDVSLVANESYSEQSSAQFTKKINTYFSKQMDSIRNSLIRSNNENDDGYHNKEEHKLSNNVQAIVIERQGGLANRFVLFLLMLWYLSSAFTLYTNKYLVTTGKAHPTIIGTVQMLVTSLCGYLQLKYNEKRMTNQLIAPVTTYNKQNDKYRSMLFWRNTIIIALLRLFSILMGLVALTKATVSFVETVKSSSPIFTVVVSQIMIGEITGFWTKISLIPIMIGLALCSSFELNFSVFGFMAAILTNFTECLQNVFSKLLLCSQQFKFTPLQVQFFSSFASLLVLLPICYFEVSFAEQNFGFLNLFLYFINGLSFHFQTLLAFTLMSYISPVTHSVCNTLKRALLIWFSVYIFGNQVGYMSAVGTIMVILGVLLYIHSKNIDKNIKEMVTRKV